MGHRTHSMNWEGELEFHSDYSYTSCVVEFALAEVFTFILTLSLPLLK